MKDFPKLIYSILICEFVGLLATPFTIAAIPSWYASLQKPFFSPPNYIFGPVWTVLYFLMGLSLYLVWVKTNKKSVKGALQLFAIQLLFNFIWSIFFFGFHSPFLGLVDIVALLVSIILTMKAFYDISKPAAYLLVPYVVWVSFATLLNMSIIFLNP